MSAGHNLGDKFSIVNNKSKPIRGKSRFHPKVGLKFENRGVNY